ncbi:hemolysin family protein [Caldilinea sp.]|uniref:hemolysin family protein n=1 Tax=Caldilinea sp. TaxID=2293560 RepID=UPI001B042DCA|nr:hemolysin family protein [Caldilinea sp.]MBO9392773.1 HlyC/CorC family transporter [Caldilinea sp.]
MESDLVTWIVLAAALFFIGLAAAAEIALSAVNRSEVRKRSEAGDPRALMLSKQLADTAQFWLTIMLLKSLGLVAAGLAVGYVLFTHFPMSGMLIGIVFTWLTLGAAQIVVRSLVLRNPDAVAFALAPVLRPIMQVLSPVTFLLYRAGLRLSGEDEEESDESIFLSEDGLRLLMQVNEEESEIQESEKQMIAGILEMNETVAREVMVPRIDMVTLEVNTPLREALDTIIEAGHSRIPVHEGHIDAIVGLLYAKDLLKCFRDQRMDVQIRELLRPPYFIPASKKVTALLREMQQQRVHLAIVIDEYGGVAGLVTIEDILEEIVGDIQDEYDVAEEVYLQPVSENTYLVNSRLDLDTLSDVLGIDLEEEEADTVGGLIYSRLGHVPEQGEALELEGWRFIVLSVDGRRINQVRIERVIPASQESDEVEAADSIPNRNSQTQNSWLKPSGLANQS